MNEQELSHTDLGPFQRQHLCQSKGDIAFLESLSGGPNIHFAHANGFNGQTYLPLLKKLSEKFNVFASDARGHGLTTLPAEPRRLRSWYRYRDDLITLLETIGPSVLAGHSMGATTSLYVAATRPDLVNGLVLIEPVIIPYGSQIFAMPANIFSNVMGLEPPLNPLSRKAAQRKSEWPDRRTILDKYRGRGIFGSWQEGFLENYIAGGTIEHEGHIELACSPAWEARAFSLMPAEVWWEATKIRCPVSILIGEAHSTCPRSRAKLLASRLKRAKWREVPGASHFLPMEQPDVVLGAIVDATRALVDA